jgi:hypothetical protein
MNKKTSQIIALFLCCILLVVTFSGCINEEQKSEKPKEATLPAVKLISPQSYLIGKMENTTITMAP